MPPVSWHIAAYIALPGTSLEASLVTRCCTNAKACGPVTSTSPMWLTSNTPAAVRTARCSATMPRYCTGIAKPPKGTILPPRATCVS